MGNFYEWNSKKIAINNNQIFNHPKEREIWWCSVGLNIGSEVYGKGSAYARPVLVINAEGSESFIGIPVTSKIKNKKYSCIIKTDDNTLHTALVYQIRSFDKRRLTKRKYILATPEYSKIQSYIKKLYKL
jgi:mRNA interferase MazF